MAKPTYEELEQKLNELKKEAVEHKQTEEALRLSEARLRTTLNSIPFDFFILDKDSRYIMQNTDSKKIWGDITGKRPEDLVTDPSTLALWKENNRRAFAGETIKEEVEFKSPKKHKFFYNIISPIRDKGKIQGILGVNIDISDLKKAEKALKNSEVEKRAILDATMELITYHATDLKVIWANRKACESAESTSDKQLIGRYCYDVWCPHNKPPDNCPALKALETGTTREIELSTPDGRFFIHRGYPVYDAKGSITGIVTTVLDITDRKRAENALVLAKARLEQLLANSPGIIYSCKPSGCFDGTFMSENIKTQLGYEALEFLEDPEFWINRIHPEDVSRILSGLEGLVEKKHLIQEYRFQHKDGAYRWMRDESKLVYDSEKKPIEIVGYWADITIQRQLEQDLQKARKFESIGILAGGIAHDFNNLLMAIQGHVSLTMAQIDSEHPLFKHCKGIEDMIKRGSNLTRQLLGFARRGNYEVKPTDLNELTKKSSEMFGQTKKEIKIHTKFQKKIWTVEVDRGQIDQVLLNLYINAWHAMPHGGNLYIETSNVVIDKNSDNPSIITPGNYVLLTVTDTGTGMGKSTIDHIFDPFFTTKEMGVGTGLGLASAYGIVKSHHGYIDVESSKGKGTTFRIYLHASKKEIKKTVEPVEEFIKGTGTVLLVDDEEIILSVSKELLEGIGFQVLTANHGKEAVEVYRNNLEKIDIVLLDMIMPGIGGGEVYDRLKEINPEVKVLLSSGYSINNQAAEILKRGCNGFIQKPFNMKALSGKIREIIG